MNKLTTAVLLLMLLTLRPLAAQEVMPELSPMEYAEQGRTLISEGNYTEAIASYEQALEIDPNFPPAYYGLGEVLSIQNDYELALKNLAQAIEMPNGFAAYPPAYLARAYAYANLGQVDEAAADWWVWTEMQMEFVDIPAEALQFGDFVSIAMKENMAFRIPFEGQANQAVSVQAEGADVDPLVLILNADAEPLVGDDDSGEDDDALIQAFTLPETGEYMLVVTHAAGGNTGDVIVTLDLSGAASESSEASSESSGAACTVLADQPQFATVRVGPGENRSTILFLPANQDFPVIGQAFADDDSLWWRLDKEAVAPDSGASELWVAQEQVISTGDCEQVGQLAAPPIIPMVSASTGDSSAESLVPTSGIWLHELAVPGILSCPDGSENLVAVEFTAHQDALTVEQDGAVIHLADEFTFSRTAPGTYEARVQGPDQSLVFTLSVLSADSIVAPAVYTFDGGCRLMITTTLTRIS